MNIIQEFIPKSTPYNRRPGRLSFKKYIIVHNNANEKSTARNELSWLTNPLNNGTASWNFVVDAKEIIEAIPRGEVSWSAGDGGNGKGNLHGISVEICESGGAEAERLAVELIAYLMVTQDIPLDDVRPHKFFSGKNCPRKILPRWNEFILDVEKEHNRLTKMEEAPAEPKKHYGYDERERLIARGVDISEERYDDNITRAESFALSNKILDAIEKMIKK